MTERQAFITFLIAIVMLTFILMSGLIAVGASSDVITLAYTLVVCIAGFGVGGIVTHYR